MFSVFPKLPQIWETSFWGRHRQVRLTKEIMNIALSLNVKIIQESFVGLCEYEIGLSK